MIDRGLRPRREHAAAGRAELAVSVVFGGAGRAGFHGSFGSFAVPCGFDAAIMPRRARRSSIGWTKRSCRVAGFLGHSWELDYNWLMARPRHPDKDVEAAVAYAEKHGWTVRISGGHAWGILFCSAASRGGCKRSVYSTPKRPIEHARRIRRAVDMCPH